MGLRDQATERLAEYADQQAERLAEFRDQAAEKFEELREQAAERLLKPQDEKAEAKEDAEQSEKANDDSEHEAATPAKGVDAKKADAQRSEGEGS